MAYEYRKIEVVPPVLQLPIVLKETNAFGELNIYSEFASPVEALVEYWMSAIVSIGDNKSPTKDDFYKLTEPDRIFVGIENFKLSVSDELTLTGPCAGCGEPANFKIDLKKLDLLPIPDGATPPDPTFTLTLPRTKHVVVVGYRTGYQELEEMKVKDFNPSRTTWRAIRSVDGDPKVKLSQIMEWPLADHIELRKFILEKQCGYDTRVKFIHSCGRRLTMNLITDPSFLTPGLAW